MSPDYEILTDPADIRRLYHIKNNIFKKIGDLKVTASPSGEPVPYEKRHKGQKNIRRGDVWGHMYGCAWLHCTGKVGERYRDCDLAAVIDTLGEGLITGEGNTAKQGISHVFNISGASEVFNPPAGKTYLRLEKGTEDVDIWMDAGYNGIGGYNIFSGRLLNAYVALMDRETYAYYFDYLCLAWATHIYGSEKKKQVRKILDRSYSAYRQGDISRAAGMIKEVSSVPSSSDLEFYCVGHSHLDLAWLWPMRETKRKAARTLSTAVKNMKLYPEYIYGASQPQEFQWIKESYPDLMEELRVLHKKGQFEPQGGMWVECDTNITGGESLIRQFLYGMRFWEEEFGETVNNCWLPDVFGYSAALPQIIKKCGIDYFMTQKLSWNTYNDFPLQTFIWKGLSDDGVLVHLLPANGYDTSCNAVRLKLTEDRHRQKDKVCKQALICYGAGDGGGGPCECDIEFIRHYSDTEGLPKLRFSKAQDLFDKLGTYKEELPQYKGELYLEKHQGTYTTQSEIKKNNRTCEHLMHTYEALSAEAVREGYDYPLGKAEELWKKILLFQFHDILPGSSVTRVNEETNAEYKNIIKEINGLIDNVSKFLSDKEEGISAYNPSPFPQKGFLIKDGRLYSYNLKAYEADVLVPNEKTKSGLALSDNKIENEFLKVSFGEDGYINSVTEKTTGMEFSKNGLNVLHIYIDPRLFFNAWDIDINYVKQKPFKLKLISAETYTEGVSVIRKNTYKFNRSTVTQKTVLTSGVPYIEFDTDVDWHETHRMLRADFYPAVFSDKAECDIQFGNIKRSTGTDNSINRAQFEVCAHKYVDVSDGKCGSAVISDSKYGYRVKDGLISLNLLRSPVYPDKNADRGIHHFRYCYYPHNGNSEEAEVIRHSYNFNYPPRVTEGTMIITAPAESTNPAVIVETIKPSEDGKCTVVRMYESLGRNQRTELKINFNYKHIYETDMRELCPHETGTELNFKPFEIKTLKIQ